MGGLPLSGESIMQRYGRIAREVHIEAVPQGIYAYEERWYHHRTSGRVHKLTLLATCVMERDLLHYDHGHLPDDIRADIQAYPPMTGPHRRE